jgi:threonine/homoserine/homoserine lactone efflux protein
MLLAMVISASSGAVSVLALPDVRLVVAIAATLYFGYLAYRIAAPPLSYTRADRNPSPLIPGILLSLDNPKA